MNFRPSLTSESGMGLEFKVPVADACLSVLIPPLRSRCVKKIVKIWTNINLMSVEKDGRCSLFGEGGGVMKSFGTFCSSRVSTQVCDTAGYCCVGRFAEE